MTVNMLTLKKGELPAKLAAIPDPPKQLYVVGSTFTELMQRPCLGIVGSRKVTAYGRSVTAKLGEAVARQGIIIISGLALGLDGLAHEAALSMGKPTIAVLPCGLDNICPSSHRNLAKRILNKGGALVTEYPPGTVPLRPNFIARNRIVSGLSEAVLIPEAAEHSGSLHTANFALEQGRDVLAVPGNITSELSRGTNNLIKRGATPVTTIEDILYALKLDQKDPQKTELIAANEQEHTILALIQDGVTDGNELMIRSELSPAMYNQTLTMLEITGRIKNLGANNWILN